MCWSSGRSGSVHGCPRFDEPPGSRLKAAERQAGAVTVRDVFTLIWPQAGIDCQAAEAGWRVQVRQEGLQHAVHVPWALVEVDRGLMLVRAVYRAGLPAALQAAAAGLSLSL